ncbi:pilus (MSHA type) biogenesis protein MshL [Roseateles koreensis]|uniref:Secretin N-terminal domain-containing protein n=1 Tax=Roseateles koreensis TaxID=2987526 RepID=A0ABT5KRE7_9BURK|nr:pilus (MSHA type) biogenesis protein MshL [Roseateles koreensis]MDC8784446.1 secretin N-terminal domain-containing protein [Roseateles koreensis]
MQTLAPTARLLPWALVALLAACADKPLQLAQPRAELRKELDGAAAANQRAAERPTSTPANAPTGASANAPASSPAAETPAARPPAPAPEPRFDLIVNGAPVRDVFLSLVTETRYSMMVHPAITGTLSVTLKGITLHEALESLRDVYGYDYKIDGRRITVFPPSMQTRVFTVNYLQHQRVGRSELRVSSGAGQSSTGSSTPTTGNVSNGSNTGNGSNSGQSQQHDSAQISTSTRNDFWADTTAALRALVGTEGGRNVIASPQAGTIAVRAMPDEMRNIEAFLRSTKLSVERQVMLEAKIVEVELREGYQSGVDWSVLGKNGAIGQTSVNPSTPTGVSTLINPLVSNTNGLPVLSTATQSPAWPDLIPMTSAGNGAFGLALSKGGFQGLISFLESHGDTQILSSPRVATLNNQKAVLKVGSDDYYITGITSGTNTASSSTSSSTTNNVIPTLTLTPFFSGISLDVTPQIDEENMVTLHIHPAVTSVTEKVKQIDLGTLGSFRLPLASNSMNETDTVVRIPDGFIVAIGGLMQSESSRKGSGLPGSDSNPVTSTLFGNRANSGRKRELIVLIKPSIIQTAQDWEQHNRAASQALEDMDDKARRVITLNGNSNSNSNAEATVPAARH